ncbi:orotate phosphoribosyltransferase [Lactiplantibacillus pentosus]|uniref:orotate phosphoribosyltransferase n=1 Tax=Lactiplantibacillus pentosus TaxID=1589 RepID=UPI003C1F006F
MSEIAATIATDLLAIQAVTLRPNAPFTWASGIKSPIYTDNRLTISYPEVRQHIASGIAAIIKRDCPETEVIAGVATAGIPHAAWVAAELHLPLIYVRSKPKDHGAGRQIEGVLKPGEKVVMLDDLISTGGSVLQAAEAVQAAVGTGLAVVIVLVGLMAGSLLIDQFGWFASKRNPVTGAQLLGLLVMILGVALIRLF